ncbi:MULTISPECIES: tautomerase family protein [Streptomyces]|uniref:tautomerase family protein n=1 Tax=Streptomyces TaxID=1883 RepID=UPI0030F49606
MPHVSLKHYPRDFTPEQKQRLADAVTRLVVEHFEVPENVVSVALEAVDPAQWRERVDAPEISARPDLLIKTPDYGN